MFEMLIAVTELGKNYKMTAEFDAIEITPLITLKPKNAFLKLESRMSG